MKHLLIAILVLSTAIAGAQPKSGGTFRTPLAGTTVLRDIEDKYNARIVSFEAPEPDGEGGREELQALKAAVARNFPHRRAVPGINTGFKTSAPALQPIIVRGFVPDSLTAIPPDNYMAVNNGADGINVMNSNVSTLNVNTGEITSRASLYNFTIDVGLGSKPRDYPRYDPKVIYDPEADRFFTVILASTNQDNYIIAGFSQSNDPAAGWNFYKFYGDYAADTTWFDYPTIAMTHNEVFLTGNKLIYNGSFQTGFRKSVIYEMRKADGYAGNALTTRIWDNVNYGGAPIRNIFPVKGGGAIKGPEQYFLSVRNMASLNDSVFLIKIGDTIGSAGNVLTVKAMKSNLVYGFPPNGRQPGVKDILQTNDARVLGAFIEKGEIQFVSTSVQPATGADAIYHGIMSNVTTTPSVTASYITVDTMDFAYPNISYTGTNAGHVTSIISFDYSGPKTYPGFGAVFWDGEAHSQLLEVKQGEAHIKTLTDTLQRWGDYTGSQPKWNAIGHVWTVGIYGKADNAYGVWMSLLRSPLEQEVPDTTTTSSVALYPNPAFHYLRLEFSLKEEATLHFAIHSMSGALIDKITDVHCERGKSLLEFNTATLATGQYVLYGVDQTGAVLVKQKFIRE